MKSRALNDLRLARIRLRKPIRQNLPAVNLEAMAACLKIVTDRARFPELGSGRGRRRYKFTSSGRERDLRRLEAIALVMMCLLSHMDLVTLRAGRRRRDNSCDPIRTYRPGVLRGRRRPPGEKLPSSVQDETGLKRWTVEKALRDLRSAGYITSHQPKRDYADEAGEKRWRSFPIVHTVTKAFLARAGIDLAWLEEQRKAARRRQEEEPAPLVDVQLVRMRQRLIRAQQLAARRARIDMASFAENRSTQLERLRVAYQRRIE